MKRFFLLGFFFTANALFAGPAVDRILASVRELRTQGVEVKRTSHQTPGSSATLEISVGKNRGLVAYQKTELIVLAAAVATEGLQEADAAVSSDHHPVRQLNALTRHTNFIVLGKEISRAYLAFEFSLPGEAGSEHLRRYLLPVAWVEEEVEQPN